MAPAAPKACTKRAPISAAIDGATAQTRVAMQKIKREASITGLRPWRSASGP